MVGYVPNDTLSHQEKVVAGAASGFITRTVTQPLEVVKIRIQLLKAKKKGGLPAVKPGILRVTQKIVKEEGISAFWHGHYLGQVHSVISVSCQFQFFEFFTKMLHQRTTIYDRHPKTANFICGTVSGCCSATVVSPIEVIRVRQMLVGQQYHGVINGAKQVYKNGGILAFYKGLGASVIQTGATVGISFGVFTTLQPIFIYQLTGCDFGHCRGKEGRDNVGSLILASSLAGSLAGLAAKTLTYPFDLAKRRLQASGHRNKKGIAAPSTARSIIRCKNLIGCLINSYRKDGFPGLFVGLTVTLLRAQITSIVAFTTYEVFCLGLRNKNFILKK